VDAAHTDDVDDELARDAGVIWCVADDLVGPGHELGATLDTADMSQPTTARTDEYRLRPRHVTRPSQ